MTGAPAAGPRRQERGRRRIEQILHAAARVFAEVGYEAATTNAIAASAGISPGSLYQYFKNKDDIAHALAEHYATRLAELRAEVFDDDADGSSVDEVLDRLLQPLVEFNLAHPGFKSLFARTDMPDGLRAAIAPVDDAIHQRVAAMVAQAVPDVDDDDVVRLARVSIQIVRGMMPLIVAAPPAERDLLTTELRTVLRGYLTAPRRD